MYNRNFEVLTIDIDGTLYDIQDVIQTVYQAQVDFVHEKTGMAIKDIKNIFWKNCIFSYKSEKARSATELFGRIGLNLEEWSKYKSRHFNVSCINLSKAVKPDTIKELSLNYKLFALTSNTEYNAIKIFERIGIERRYFSRIITSDNYLQDGPFDKKKIMKSISEELAVCPKNMLSIGDRYDTDIRPMLEIGGNGLLLYEPRGLENFVQGVFADEKKDTYKYYESQENE